jgi:hypothetical protein
MVDMVYNGTMYGVNLDVVYIQSVYNATSPPTYSRSTGTPYTTVRSCIYNTITGVSMEKLDVNFTKPQPRCSMALDMYCPNNKDKNICIVCVVQNQAKLISCSIIEEENWCNGAISVAQE